MENPEEILHSLEEFSKMKPKDIPRELEEYLSFVAKTGNPVYQWPTIKSLFREKLLNVITEFYESCPTIDIPACPNVEMFNYDLMKNFILEKLDTFSSAPFTVQRICELLTSPRKEYNRIDKYMRALEKNILVVSTTEPGRRSTENGEGIMNGIESEHIIPESSNATHDINVDEMDETPAFPRAVPVLFEISVNENVNENQEKTDIQHAPAVVESFETESEIKIEIPPSSTITENEVPVIPTESVITCTNAEEPDQPFVSIEAVPATCGTFHQDAVEGNQVDISVTITAVPAGVHIRRSSVERVGESNPETVAIEEIQTVVAEDVKEETVATMVEEQILPVASSTEIVEELPASITKIEAKLVETVAVVHEPVIENISPENASVAPDIQVESFLEAEKRLEISDEISSSSEKEVIVEAGDFQKEEINMKVQEEMVMKVQEEMVAKVQEEIVMKVQEEMALKVQEEMVKAEIAAVAETLIEDKDLVPESYENGILDESIKVEESLKADTLTDQHLSDELKNSSEILKGTVDVVDGQLDSEEEKPEIAIINSEIVDSKKDTEETPMEVDIVSETELDKDVVSDEPSSTSSSDTAL